MMRVCWAHSTKLKPRNRQRKVRNIVINHVIIINEQFPGQVLLINIS